MRGEGGARTLIGLLHLQEPLCRGLPTSRVGLLIRVENDGERTVSFADFLVDGGLGKVEDRADWAMSKVSCGGNEGKYSLEVFWDICWRAQRAADILSIWHLRPSGLREP